MRYNQTKRERHQTKQRAQQRASRRKESYNYRFQRYMEKLAEWAVRYDRLLPLLSGRDASVIAKDWQAVGDDMRAVMGL